MFCFLDFHGDAAQLSTFSLQFSGRHLGYTVAFPERPEVHQPED
jgi:hypothetical protein